jgi:opacity protein-like surface antigen
MGKPTTLHAAICALGVALAAPALPATADAQMSTIVENPAPSSAEAAAVADGSVPGWYRRVGEGPFSLREPGRGVYFILGGHAGFANSTRLRDKNGCDNPDAFFLGCENEPPSDSLGTGGGGSIGIGTRLTPAVRVALIATGETGYHFHNDKPWVAVAFDESFVEKFSLHSYQGTANIYLDVAGLLPPGVLGGFNPYLMSGLGIAFNTTSETKETDTLPGGVTVTNTYPGGTEESLLWTVGAGVQYRIAPGVVADVSYQYVDAGRFTAASGRPQTSGLTGQPFDPPFRPIQGNLETHRVGFAVNIELETIGRWFGRRP